MADIIQSDYEQLDGLAARFGQRAEATQEMLAAVRQGVDDLQSGGWEGKGSAAFFAEMESKMFPATERLAAALEEARAVTQKIREILGQAEEEAAALFRGQPSGLPAGPGAAVPGTGPGVATGRPVPTGGGAGPGTTAPSTPGGRPADGGGGIQDFLENNPMVGFRLFGFAQGPKILKFLMGASAPSQALMRGIPVAGGVIGTILNIAKANANGENMDFAVGREITKGTLKTEVYLVPGLNIVAGGAELAHMFGLTDTNYTDKVVNTVAEPVHKYALDPASDVLAEGMWQVDQGIRRGISAAGELIDDLEWPF